MLWLIRGVGLLSGGRRDGLVGCENAGASGEGDCAMSVRDYAVESAEINAAVAGDTLPRAFLRTAAANPGVVALRRMVGDGGDGWAETTYRQLSDQVAGVAAGLQAGGLRPGQRMVLMMRNRPEFHVVDLAATFLRATPASIYNSSSADELQYLVDHAEAEIAVVEDVGFLERFAKVRAELPRPRTSNLRHQPARGRHTRRRRARRNLALFRQGGSKINNRCARR